MKISICILFVVGVLLPWSDCKPCGTSQWAKLNALPVCFSGKNNQPGTVHSLRSGFIAAVKLVHKSGVIRCAGKIKYDSYFGCNDFPNLEAHPLNVVVTNDKNQIMFPVGDRVSILHRAYWYGLDGANSMSNEIVLPHNFAQPYFVYSRQILHVWYGEDLKNQWEGDNVGRVCVDVYGYFV